MRPRTQNPKGYFENNDIVKINDGLLKEFGYRWDDIFPLPANWQQKSSLLKEWQPKMRALLRNLFHNSEQVAIKDPRMCRLYPIWKETAEGLGIPTACILTVRNPFEVAQSLQRRDGFSEQKSLLMWMAYTLEAEFHSKKDKRVFTSFDELIEDPESQVERLRNILEVEFPVSFEAAKQQVTDFLDAGLKHHSTHITHTCWVPDNMVQDLFDQLNNIIDSGHHTDQALAAVDRIRAEFNRVCDFYYHPDIIERSRVSLIMGVSEHSRTWKAYRGLKSILRSIM